MSVSDAVRRLLKCPWEYSSKLEDGIFTVVVTYAHGKHVSVQDRSFDKAVYRALEKAGHLRKASLAQMQKRR